MAHTNSTPNYNLPQFLGTDKPAWLTDINNAMSDIDTAIAAAKTTADSADTAVSALGITVGNHTSQLSTLSGAVTSQGNTLNTVTALIGNGTPTTTDQTIIGAINEINAIVQPGYVEVTADGVKTISQLLDALYALVDLSKLTRKTVLEYMASGNTNYYGLAVVLNNELYFTSIDYVTASNAGITNITVKSSGSSQIAGTFTNVPAISFTDVSSTVVPSGQKYKIAY